jgi:sugar phosphate isomerase/epimerase
MIDLANELGVQSFCFRGFPTNEEVAQKVKECGLSAIEICQKHIDFTDESGFEAALAVYRDAGVKIVSIGVQGFSNDEAKETEFFEFAKMAGAKFIAATFALGTTPESFRTAEKLGDKYDICLALHNHGGKDWLGSGNMIRRTMKNTSERIGLCLDTAWAIDSREDPVKLARDCGKKLYGIHFKDFIYERTREPKDVVIGTGNLDLPGLMQALKDVDFNGYAVLEYEGDVSNPVPALRDCVTAVHREAANV